MNQRRLILQFFTISFCKSTASQIIQFNRDYQMMRQLALLFLLFSVSLAYNTQLASELTHYSAITYENASAITSWSCDLCKKFTLLSPTIVENATGNVFGYVGYSPTHSAIVVAFRGSTDVANWIINLSTTRTKYDLCDGCTVHVGFNAGYNMVKAQVIKAVEERLELYRGSKIYVTGHSLGGALGVMAAAHLQSLYGVVDQLYTMGQPRVGNDVFAQFMTSYIPNTFRIVNYADQVPHVPQSVLGFKHSGYEIWYQRGMQTYTICPSESKACSNQLTILTLTQADHKMALYIQLKVDAIEMLGWIKWNLAKLKGKVGKSIISE